MARSGWGAAGAESARGLAAALRRLGVASKLISVPFRVGVALLRDRQCPLSILPHVSRPRDFSTKKRKRLRQTRRPSRNSARPRRVRLKVSADHDRTVLIAGAHLRFFL